jgi:hypothetical protein
MRSFTCPKCRATVFFNNLTCLSCGSSLSYHLDRDDLALNDGDGCASRETAEQCNWSTQETWCASCALDTDHEARPERLPFQSAKRRTLRLLSNAGIDPAGRSPQLQFDMRQSSPGAPVTIGHAYGLVTIDTAEADPARREAVRTELGEPYRTPVGHVRHETGHWFWAAAVDDCFTLDAFRALFGDEQQPYDEALERHYLNDDDGSWRTEHVTHYASAHPWEDFAESFAHYLHLVDTTETAAAFGLITVRSRSLRRRPRQGFEQLYSQWADLSVALNELNQAMGADDPYPFAPSARAVEKIAFVADALPIQLATG